MTAITETENNEVREQILALKESLKKEAAVQKVEKDLLRTPHDRLPEEKISGSFGVYSFQGIRRAGRLMNTTRYRACTISQMHIEYNKLRGKPFDMHEKKKI